jgi:hypothetical protein
MRFQHEPKNKELDRAAALKVLRIILIVIL